MTGKPPPKGPRALINSIHPSSSSSSSSSASLIPPQLSPPLGMHPLSQPQTQPPTAPRAFKRVLQQPPSQPAAARRLQWPGPKPPPTAPSSMLGIVSPNNNASGWSTIRQPKTDSQSLISSSNSNSNASSSSIAPPLPSSAPPPLPSAPPPPTAPPPSAPLPPGLQRESNKETKPSEPVVLKTITISPSTSASASSPSKPIDLTKDAEPLSLSPHQHVSLKLPNKTPTMLPHPISAFPTTDSKPCTPTPDQTSTSASTFVPASSLSHTHSPISVRPPSPSHSAMTPTYIRSLTPPLLQPQPIASTSKVLLTSPYTSQENGASHNLDLNRDTVMEASEEDHLTTPLPWLGLPRGNWKVTYDPRLADAWERSQRPKDKEKEPVRRTDGGEEGTGDVKDPRRKTKGLGAEGKGRSVKAWREKVYLFPPYEHDENSIGPPPPTAIFVKGLNPLVLSNDIRAHFKKYGEIQVFEQQIDKATGAMLGVVWIKFDSHATATQALQKSHGKPLSGITAAANANAAQYKMVVEFDGEKEKLNKFLKETEDVRREKEKERRRIVSAGKIVTNGFGGTPQNQSQNMTNTSTTPIQGSGPGPPTSQTFPNGTAVSISSAVPHNASSSSSTFPSNNHVTTPTSAPLTSSSVAVASPVHSQTPTSTKTRHVPPPPPPLPPPPPPSTLIQARLHDAIPALPNLTASKAPTSVNGREKDRDRDRDRDRDYDKRYDNVRHYEPRDKDRDRSRDRHYEPRERGRDRDRDNDRHYSPRDRDNDRHYSPGRDWDRSNRHYSPRDRDRDRDNDRHYSSRDTRDRDWNDRHYSPGRDRRNRSISRSRWRHSTSAYSGSAYVRSLSRSRSRGRGRDRSRGRERKRSGSRSGDRYLSHSRDLERDKVGRRERGRERSRDKQDRRRSRSHSIPSPSKSHPHTHTLTRASEEHILSELAKTEFEYIRLDVAGLGIGLEEEGDKELEKDVRDLFAEVDVDKVLHDLQHFYITFKHHDTARRCQLVLAQRTLHGRTLALSVHQPSSSSLDQVASGTASIPTSIHDTTTPSTSVSSSTGTGPDTEAPSLLVNARDIIVRELRQLLEKDVTERVIGVRIREMIEEARTKRREEREREREVRSAGGEFGFGLGVDALARITAQQGEVKVGGTGAGLKGLSFKKKKREREEDERGDERDEKKRRVGSLGPEVPETDREEKVEKKRQKKPKEEDDRVEEDEEQRQFKRRKVEEEGASIKAEKDRYKKKPGATPAAVISKKDIRSRRRIDDSDEESEVELQERHPDNTPFDEEKAESDAEVDHDSEQIVDTVIDVPLKGKRPKSLKQGQAQVKTKGKGQQRTQAKVKGTKGREKERLSSQVGESTPIPVSLRSPSPSVSPSPTPTLPDLIELGLCEDDEDIYFAKAVIGEELGTFRHIEPGEQGSEDETETTQIQAEEPPVKPPRFREHVTGSARTEGYYKIPHSEKAYYVKQYTVRASTNTNGGAGGANGPDKNAIEAPAPTVLTSSRSNRASARGQARGMDDLNRALALSLVDTGPTIGGGGVDTSILIKFNQLQTRKKQLRFARSPIHDWGLYAMERIAKGEMVIEYVGEVIRQAVADQREKAYERQGIGSSYLFRIDDDVVVDATKKGNLGRLINHSCDPNCTAKIITINGEKKIVIYAKQDIELGDEITYDYHFPIEQEKIPCLCGAAKCRGYLN